MSEVFNHAVRHAWLDKDPITLQRSDSGDPHLRGDPRAACRNGTAGPTLVLLDAGTGLRVGELLGLKWLRFVVCCRNRQSLKQEGRGHAPQSALNAASALEGAECS